MSRFSYAGALLALAALLPAPISAQKPAAAPKSIPNAPRVQHVVVRGSGADMEVEIQTSGAPVAPDTQLISGPDRIVVDFPGALPADELRALKVNRGALKRIRSGLFFSKPPITRVVLDLSEPQSYKISTIPNAIVIKLGSAKLNLAEAIPGNEIPTRKVPAPASAGSKSAGARVATLQNAALGPAANVGSPKVSHAVADAAVPVAAVSEAPPPPKPLVTVTFENGMLRLRAERATLAQVLFEVQRQTQAEIAIPAGAEQEEVFADLGPAPARDVLASLLNGSSYNFIFVGHELRLEQVILTRRDPSIF